MLAQKPAGSGTLAACGRDGPFMTPTPFHARTGTAKSARLSLLLCLTMVSSAMPTGRAATVAYWRFENGPALAAVPHAGAAGAFDGTVPDESGNGNTLSASTAGGSSGYAFRTDVPY